MGSSSTSPATRAAASSGGQPEVEHAITFDQFKTDKGLTWPRRVTKTIDGKKSDEMNVTKFRINPKFGKDAFQPR